MNDRNREIQVYIWEAITKILLNSKMTLEEKKKNLYSEEQETSQIIWDAAKNIEELMESWIIEDQEDSRIDEKPSESPQD